MDETTVQQQAPVFDVSRLENPERQGEWVTLPRLGPVYVRELLMGESATISRYSTRPEVAGGGTDREEAALWQIAFSCYDGEGEAARRLFPDTRVHLIKHLKLSEFALLMETVNRVNGAAASEAEILRDFTPAGRDAPS